MMPPSLAELFDHPPRAFGPTPLWWWSGAAVTPERLAWQMAAFDEGGIHNLVVINLAPAGPLFGAVTDEPRWFSDTWWERFTQACEIAAERDMRLWFYDQIGFSGADVQGGIAGSHPEVAGASLRSRAAAVAGGRLQLAAGETLVGAYRLDGRRLDSTPDGRIAGAREGDAANAITSVPTAYDYLSSEAVALLIDRVHGEYDRRVPQHLGTVIAGSFQDELPATNAWTPRFAAEFRDRRGYDILDHLPALFGGTGPTERKVRGDYYAVRAALAEEVFFHPLARWHSERGMLIGADQSHPARAGYPTQATQLYSDYLRTHRWYGAAGSDHEGDAKIHSSIAHLYEHPRVWIEAFHSSGWGGTLDETYDWLLPFLRSGANLYNPHATYFGTAGGWFEWAPPSTDWRQPYWQQYPAFATAVARIASMMSWGTYDAEVAVLHPTSTAQADLTLDLPVDHFGDGRIGGAGNGDGPPRERDAAQEVYLALVGTNNWFHPRIGALDAARISFDVIDEDSIVREPLGDGRIVVAAQTYRAIVLPSATVLGERTARRLIDLLDAGGRVIVVGVPPREAAGLRGDDATVTTLATHPRLERVPDAAHAADALTELAGHAVSDVPLLVRRSGRYGVALVLGAYPGASGPRSTASVAGVPAEASFDPGLYARERTVRVKARVTEAIMLDPATGRRSPATVAHEDGGSVLTVRTDGAPAVLVAWREAAAGESAAPVTPPAAPRCRSTELDDGWTGELVPTMDNTWGDLALPVGSDVAAIQVWEFEWREQGRPGTATAKATYGERCRTFGPVAAEDAPAPLDVRGAQAVLGGERPLAPDDWAVNVHSRSRGAQDPGRGTLGLKGIVPEEFVRVPATGPGELASVRALVRSDIDGRAELIVGAGAVKDVWWNGLPVIGHGDEDVVRVLVEVAPVNVLEYRLGENRNSRAVAGAADVLGSFFTLARPGDFPERPRYLRAPEALAAAGTVTYRARVDLPADAERATLIVGATSGAVVRIDGELLARQAEVDYYGAEWGPIPAHFTHDATAALRAGSHEVSIETRPGSATDVVFVDLVAHTAQGIVTLMSGPGWSATAGGVSGDAVAHLGHWDEPASTHAAHRPHPLPRATWLRGEPETGRTPPDLAVTDDVAPAAQILSFRMPAGAEALDIPLRLPAEIEIDGHARTWDGDTVVLDAPPSAPTTVTIRTEPTAFLRGGSALDGPVLLRTGPAPITLGDWRDIGLASWSGGVRYRRRIVVPEECETARLDLGRIRGSVRVEVDGDVVGDLFCVPYVVDLGARRGELDLAITVNNTLAPFLAASTPTAWAFPSQRGSGLYGPVTLLTA